MKEIKQDWYFFMLPNGRKGFVPQAVWEDPLNDCWKKEVGLIHVYKQLTEEGVNQKIGELLSRLLQMVPLGEDKEGKLIVVTTDLKAAPLHERLFRVYSGRKLEVAQSCYEDSTVLLHGEFIADPINQNESFGLKPEWVQGEVVNVDEVEDFLCNLGYVKDFLCNLGYVKDFLCNLGYSFSDPL